MEVGVKKSNKTMIIQAAALIGVLIVGVWFGLAKNSVANSTPQDAADTLVKALLNSDTATIVKLNYSKVHEQELKSQFAQRFPKSSFSDFTIAQVSEHFEIKNKQGSEINFFFDQINGKYYLTRVLFVGQ